MIAGPLDLERMAVRIETLQRVRPHDWLPGDEMSFKQLLPGSRGRQVLPEPERLREVAKMMRGDSPVDEETKTWLNQGWRLWLTWAQRAEGYIRNNDPRKFNPRRMMRDMQRGKWPH